ncbi:MAG TPA: hypothetical protein VFR94_00540 [Nitrososphaeraceae archaeon]|nr:hypothetical protein [Nitrososphaeraceae archaeon]
MVRNLSVVLFLACLLLSLVSYGSVNFNPFDKKIYAHIFNTDETASFIAITDQIQVESQLVKTNLANNNLSLAQNHANKAASLLTPDIVSEVSEANEGIADKLLTEVSDLQKISSSSDEQQQMVNQLVSDINTTLGEAIVVRTQQRQQDDSSNFLENGIEFLRGIFGGGSQESYDKIEVNSTTQPLAFADLVDSVLINYGNAYAVDFDMTNMSNMAMMGGNSDMMTMSGTAGNSSNSNNGKSMNMDSMNMSSSASSSMDVDNKTDNKTDRNYSLVDITDYQSAQALTTKAQEILNTKLKPMAPNNSSAFITNLENGLTQLSDLIQRKSSPMDVMMIVHMQIHPNLLEAFNLSLRQG